MIPKLTEHTFANGVCACGAKQYSVTITVDGTAQNYTPVVEAGETADMSSAACVLENLGLMGAPLPQVLLSALEALKKEADAQ